MKRYTNKMKRYTTEELKKIIENHQHWLKEDCDNWEHMRANLSKVDLSKVDLSDTNLRGANLYCANLSYADLHYANLYQADLRGADLNNAKNIPFIPYACPDTGSFIGYKKAGAYIVELKILSDARRCSATGRKCRCDRAEVLSIQHFDKNIPCDKKAVASDYDSNFIY